MQTIQLTKVVSEDLAIREVAQRFFDYVDSLRDTEVTLDFKGVRSISRSFAHEYLRRKRQSPKTVSETNVPDNVWKMFSIVRHPTAKPRLIDLHSIRVVPA